MTNDQSAFAFRRGFRAGRLLLLDVLYPVKYLADFLEKAGEKLLDRARFLVELV